MENRHKTCVKTCTYMYMIYCKPRPGTYCMNYEYITLLIGTRYRPSDSTAVPGTRPVTGRGVSWLTISRRLLPATTVVGLGFKYPVVCCDSRGPPSSYLTDAFVARVLSFAFSTAVPFWGQITWDLNGLSPEWDCSSERGKAGLVDSFHYPTKAHSYRRACFPLFPKFGNTWRYVSIYGGALSLFVKFPRRKANQVR